MNNRLARIFGVSLMFAATPLFAKVNVFACEPEWAALAEEIGGNRVAAFSATTPFQDPHYIQARPSLIARVRRADLVICTGANLEIGWLPVLLRQAGNGRVMAGTDGFLEASAYVSMLDVPGQVDRAAGDLHPYGNPHIQLDPGNIGRVAKALLARLVQIDIAGRDYYEKRHTDFERRWNDALGRWRARATDLDGMQIVVHHRSWVYLENWLGLEEVAALEPKPGLPPTAAHLAQLLEVLENSPAEVVIRSAYQTSRASDWLTERTGTPSVVLPQTVGAAEGADDLFTLFDVIIERLLEMKR